VHVWLPDAASTEFIVKDTHCSAAVLLTDGSPGCPELHADNSIDQGWPGNGEFDLLTRTNRMHRFEQDATPRNVNASPMSGCHDGLPVQKEVAQFCSNRKAVTRAPIFRRTRQLDLRAHNEQRSAASVLSV
jgi:hypothetical protein